MGWKIVSRPDCVWCVRAKSLLAVNGIDFEEDLRDTNEKRLAFKASGFTSFPQIFNGNQHIGGFTDLKEYLDQR